MLSWQTTTKYTSNVASAQSVAVMYAVRLSCAFVALTHACIRYAANKLTGQTRLKLHIGSYTAGG